MRNVLKICSVLVLALALVLGMFSAAFAAGSATDPVEFFNGEDKVSVTVDPAEEDKLDATEAATLAGSSTALTEVWYGTIDSEFAGKELTCKVYGAGSSDKFYVFHFDGEKWDKAYGPYTGEEFAVTFDALSPVAVFKATEAPKTGDDSNLLLWGGLMAVAAAAAVGTVVYSKKRRSEA